MALEQTQAAEVVAPRLRPLCASVLARLPAVVVAAAPQSRASLEAVVVAVAMLAGPVEKCQMYLELWNP
jgi:hypothetical protein